MKLLRPISEGQKQVYNADARFLWLAIGRRWGKSAFLRMRHVLRSYKETGQTYIWAMPTMRQNRSQFRLFINEFSELIKSVNRTDLQIQWQWESVTVFLSDEQGDAARGLTADGITLDEAAYMRENFYANILRPMIATTQGWLEAGSTPRGKNWFYREFHKAQNAPDSLAYSFPTYENPLITKDEIELMKGQLTSLGFQQEIEALFIDHGGEVFRNISDCVKGEFEEPQDGPYVMGVDLAKQTDFTVLTVLDINRKHVVHIDRFNKIAYPLQKQRIAATARKYNAKVVIDSTGVGEPIYDDLRQAGLYIEPFRFTNESKIKLIDKLSILIEKREITFPDFAPLIGELNLYEIQTTASGNFQTYNAPTGYHDDCVISLALAAWGLGVPMISVGTRGDLF